MWSKTCLAGAVCVALTVVSISSAKALLVDGSYNITLTGDQIDPSPGTFDVVGTAIQYFTLDLLVQGAPASSDPTYSSNSPLRFGPPLRTDPSPSMFSGVIGKDTDPRHQMILFGAMVPVGEVTLFPGDGKWRAITAFPIGCGIICGIRRGPSGSFTIAQTSVSEIPLPAALPLFLAALSALGLLGWCRRRAV